MISQTEFNQKKKYQNKTKIMKINTARKSLFTPIRMIPTTDPKSLKKLLLLLLM